MKWLAALLVFVLIGCGTSYEVARDIEPPELIGYAPLPLVHPLPNNRIMKLKVFVCVKQDGTVEHARLITSSGDPAWDSLAEQSILQWRYAPPLRNGVPTDVWVHQQIVVQFDDPILMSLSQLSASSQSQADSLYALLEKGIDFEALVQQFAAASRERGGYLGTVDVRLFAPRVREALKELHEGDYTHPVRVGDRYVIFKRVNKVAS